MSDDTLLSPGVQIKPLLNEKSASNLVEKFYGLKVKFVKELVSYDDKNFLVRVELVHNEHVGTVWEHGYVFKVTNSLDSKNPSFFEAQHDMMIHLNEKGFNCPLPTKNLDGRLLSVEYIEYDLEEEGDNRGGRHIIRLLTFIPGKMMVEIPFTTTLFYRLGKYVARVDNALVSFKSPQHEIRDSIWKLSNVPKLRQFIDLAIKEPTRLKMVNDVVSKFENNVSGLVESMPQGIIHGDLNENNIIVKESDDGFDIGGMIDFGDSHKSCYVFELAVATMYCLMYCKDVDPVLVPAHVVAGWLTERPLEPDEWRVFKTCIEGRFCQSLVMGAYSHLNDPDNSYVLSSAITGWTCLEKLTAESSEDLYHRWEEIILSYGPSKYSLP